MCIYGHEKFRNVVTFFGGAGLTLRFGVSCSDVDIFNDVSFVTFAFVVDDDRRTADDGLDGGLSFFCGLDDSLPRKNDKTFQGSNQVLFFKKKWNEVLKLTAVGRNASASNTGRTWFSRATRAPNNTWCWHSWCGHCTSWSWTTSRCHISRSWSYSSNKHNLQLVSWIIHKMILLITATGQLA